MVEKDQWRMGNGESTIVNGVAGKLLATQQSRNFGLRHVGPKILTPLFLVGSVEQRAHWGTWSSLCLLTKHMQVRYARGERLV